MDQFFVYWTGDGGKETLKNVKRDRGGGGGRARKKRTERVAQRKVGSEQAILRKGHYLTQKPKGSCQRKRKTNGKSVWSRKGGWTRGRRGENTGGLPRKKAWSPSQRLAYGGPGGVDAGVLDARKKKKVGRAGEQRKKRRGSSREAERLNVNRYQNTEPEGKTWVSGKGRQHERKGKKKKEKDKGKKSYKRETLKPARGRGGA